MPGQPCVSDTRANRRARSFDATFTILMQLLFANIDKLHEFSKQIVKAK